MRCSVQLSYRQSALNGDLGRREPRGVTKVSLRGSDLERLVGGCVRIGMYAPAAAFGPEPPFLTLPFTEDSLLYEAALRTG